MDKHTSYLLVTCRPGNEGWCEEEVGNVVFHLDPGVVIERTGFSGVLLVKTSAPLDTVYRRLKSREYGFVERIIPLQRLLNNPDVTRIISAVEELLDGYRGSVRLYVVFRGVRGVSSIVWREVVRKLRSMGIRLDRSSSKCLHIESIGRLVGISFVDCWRPGRRLIDKKPPSLNAA